MCPRLYKVEEYWIVNWQLKSLDVYRRANDLLQVVGTFSITDTLTYPLFPGFSLAIADLFPS